MSLTLIKEDGSGLANANSYASAADGDAYHDGHFYASTWTIRHDREQGKGPGDGHTAD